MTGEPITYEDLFSLLLSLGFHQQPRGKADSRPHVFIHDPTDTVLAFGREVGEPVTPADMLSTEVHLHARGILEQPLASLLNAIAVNE